MSQQWRKYLLWFAQEHVDFRFAEMDSIIKMFNIPIQFDEEPSKTQPYWIVNLQSENDINILASRSVSLRFCQELWAHADTTNALHKKLKLNPQNSFDLYLREDKTFKIEVETFCRHFTQSEKIKKIETFNYLPVRGVVRLKDPDVCLQYIEYYGEDPNQSPELPLKVFFGRWITNGLRQLISRLSLKTRKFIGNTSMDAQLSLLMANQAQVKAGDLVLDPFVGSGSLLVAAAQFGGYVLGTDIDYLMLHAKTRPSRINQQARQSDESVRANMKQYNLENQYLDVVVNDFSLPIWRCDFTFDSIITDPPYGIREATEKIGINRNNYEISEENIPTHIPSKIQYGLGHLYNDLLVFSAKRIKLGGHLVCWFPVFREDYSIEFQLPSHPCFKLIANSEQVLSKYTARRLLTYEKIKEFHEQMNSEAVKQVSDFRDKYFALREETRVERRMKKAALKEQGRLEYLRRNGFKDGNVVNSSSQD